MAYRVIGAAIEVHRHLGPGFLEAVYEDVLCVEFNQREIPYERQYPVSVEYNGQAVGAGKMDLLVDGMLIGELKATENLVPVHFAQVLSYLKASGIKLGLLINFDEAILKQGIKRVVLT